MSEDKKKGKDSKKKGGTKDMEASDIVAPTEAPTPRMKVKYRTEVAAKLKEALGLPNIMQVPRITKVVINAGLGRSTQNIKIIDVALKDITALAGQKAVATKSKQAISNFKLRKGLPIGVMVTLRGDQMWEFLDRLVSLTLPRIRDFRGISDRAFDGRGNYTLGLKDHLVFPEVSYDSVDSSFGLNVTIATTAQTDDQGRALLTHLGFPFRKRTPATKAA